MGKIVKLKNKKTGERVYPVTATKAVVDADSGERLNDTLLNKVEEAPMDGNQYVRSGGVWKVAELASAGIERCNISLVSNQGESDASSLYGATVKVTDVDSTEVYYNGVWDGTEISVEFAPGVNYKVEVGAVADYATPESKTFTALEQNVRNAVMTYQTEIVSVTLSSGNGVSVVGQIVTINGTQHTWNGTTISQKVAFGTSYSVSVDGKSGFIRPSSQSFTANRSARDLTMMYVYVQYGVFIQGVSGELYLASTWNNQESPNGIAVITENCRFVIALADAYNFDCTWGDNETTVSNILTTEDLSTAQGDYLGDANTTQIISQLGASSAPAANHCRSYTFPNGATGYLGAAGEWQTAIDNRSAIETALTACGGRSMSSFYWTSTQSSSSDSWGIGWNYANPACFTKSYEFYVRAFAAI